MAAPTIISMTLQDDGSYEALFSDQSRAKIMPAVIMDQNGRFISLNADGSVPTTGGGAGGTAQAVNIADALTPSNKATVSQFHSADNQSPGGTAYGLLTGGVAQLLNAAGNLDRQRETGADSIPSLGVATGTAQLVSPFTVTVAATQTAGANKVITPSAMSGYNRGAPWSIQVGSILVMEPTPVGGPVPANQEVAVVTAVTSTTFTATLTKSHTGTFSVAGTVLNQARDATITDGAVGLGLAAGATYLLNTGSNAGAGGWEGERSAAGELDGATGTGTAIAAEYEWNGGGPYTGTALSGLAYDRARNLQGKGLGSGTLANNPLAAGATTLTLNVAPTTLQAGQQVVLDRAGANPEVAYVVSTYTVGSTTVGLQSATRYAHNQNTTVEWDQLGVLGPGLTGFTPAGIGIEEEALYNPVDGLYYIERAATQDAMPPQNVVVESGAVWNGTTMDRMRAISALGDGLGVEASMQPSSAPSAATAAANTNVVATITGVASQQHRLTMLSVSYSAAPTGGRCTVSDGTTTYDWDVTAAGVTQLVYPFEGGIKFAAGATVTITLYAGGAAVVGKVNVAKLTA